MPILNSTYVRSAVFAVSDSALERVWREDCPLLDVTVHALGIEANARAYAAAGRPLIA